jgi:molecular chaperone HscA
MATLLQIHEPGETPTPHSGGPRLAIGIDLGTTNSVVAVSDKNNPEILRDEDGRALVPSTIAYAPDGSFIVGGLANDLLIERPECVVTSVKRLMGRGLKDVKSLAGVLPFDVEPQTEDESGMVRLKVAGHKLTPVKISADILSALKARAEEHLGHVVDQAVITVPAYFDDGARTATKDAAKLAGIEVLRLVNEPTAAALAYGLDKGTEGTYAVYDLGGGTFDVSILRMEKGVFQVLATGGDAALGGDDFDHVIAEHFLKDKVKDKLNTSEVKMTLMTARRAKECLSTENRDEWSIEIDGNTSYHKLDRATFEGLISPLVEHTIDICKTVSEDASLLPEEIKGVVLVGGSTRIPLVRQKVAELFGKDPLSDINPDEVVAVGAALQAEALTVGSETLLLDVTPLSLGIETMGGMVEKIIPRNTTIPVAKAQEFTTYIDGQTAMTVHATQGEREMVEDNRSLARFELHGIPPMTAGAARIRVTFAVDADGLLTVSAMEDTTGVEAEVAVKPSYGINEEEMAEMLYNSMKYAKDDMEERLLAESRVEAGRNLNAVSAALSKDKHLLSSTQFAEIQAVICQLEDVVKGTDRDAITEAAEQLEKATKDFAEKRMDQGIRMALRGVDVDTLDEQASKG